jgi:glutathione S-transferase
MKLFYSTSDYCLLKVKLVAGLTGTVIDVESKTQEELVALDAAAKGLLLEVDGQYISQHLAILRYLAESSPKANQLLLEDVERAQINQWLEFSWEELGK